MDVGTNCSEILQWERETGLNSQYSRGKWEVLATEQSWEWGVVITKRKYQG